MGNEPIAKESEPLKLDDLLSKLYTNEGRYKVLTMLAERDLLNGSKYVRDAIKYYENKGAFFDAWFLAKKNGYVEKSREFYEKAFLNLERDGIFGLTAKLREDIGDIKGAIKNYEKSGDFESAAILSEKMGNIKRAIRNCKRSGHSFYINKILSEKNGDVEKSREFYEKEVEFSKKEKRFNFIAKLFEDIGDIEGAFKYYGKAKNFESITRLSKKQGNLEKAIQICESEKSLYSENYIYAGELCEELGDIERAIKNYEKGEYFGDAAILAKKSGNSKKTKELYKKAIKNCMDTLYFVYAAHLAERLGDINGAKEFYEKEIKNRDMRSFLKKQSIGSIKKEILVREKNWSFETAAMLAEMMGDIGRAIKDYEKAGWYAYAIKLGEKNNNLKKAIESCEKGGLFDYAAHLAERLGDVEKTKAYKDLIDILN